jgi:hypothetical protein
MKEPVALEQVVVPPAQVEDLTSAQEVEGDFDLDVRVSIGEDSSIVGAPRMDGWTTYTTCHGTCANTSCACSSSPADPQCRQDINLSVLLCK